jgi:hypothetical protein
MIITLPQNPKMSRVSSISEIMQARQKSLEELYIRRATVINLIHSLEVYHGTPTVPRAKAIGPQRATASAAGRTARGAERVAL